VEEEPCKMPKQSALESRNLAGGLGQGVKALLTYSGRGPPAELKAQDLVEEPEFRSIMTLG
jgi:hypothetical protein